MESERWLREKGCNWKDLFDIIEEKEKKVGQQEGGEKGIVIKTEGAIRDKEKENKRDMKRRLQMSCLRDEEDAENLSKRKERKWN